MAYEAKDETARGIAPGWRGQRALRLLHALLLVALGGWLLTRALQTLMPDARLAAAMAFADPATVAFATAALVLGVLLLVAAMALPNGRAWAWLGAAAGSLAALALLTAAWVSSGNSDWPGLLLAVATVIALAAPAARELYLN